VNGAVIYTLYKIYTLNNIIFICYFLPTLYAAYTSHLARLGIVLISTHREHQNCVCIADTIAPMIM
jgi:hypothetical protein